MSLGSIGGSWAQKEIFAAWRAEFLPRAPGSLGNFWGSQAKEFNFCPGYSSVGPHFMLLFLMFFVSSQLAKCVYLLVIYSYGKYENCHLQFIVRFPMKKTVISHSYVSLSDGNYCTCVHSTDTSCAGENPDDPSYMNPYRMVLSSYQLFYQP